MEMPQDFVVLSVFHTETAPAKGLSPVFDTVEPAFPLFFHTDATENHVNEPACPAVR
jgi:hypothetical protein